MINQLKNLVKGHWPEILILLLSLLLRTVLLGIKPPHFDEGVNGWFVDQMVKQGYFKYDPANYHGPLHFYVLFLSLELFGRNLWAIRLPIVLVSTLCVWMVLRFERFFGKRVCQYAALAMAVSPAMVFYGRYAIHESWLVLFLLKLTWGIFELWRAGSLIALCATVFGATGMILTKETYIIHFVCIGLAWVTWKIAQLVLPADKLPVARQTWKWSDLAIAIAISLGLIVFFYTGNFLLPWGPALANLYLTFAAWEKTGQAGQSGHEKPAYDISWLTFHYNVGHGPSVHQEQFAANYYWFYLLFRYEWPALLGAVAALFMVCRGVNGRLRFLAIYGMGAIAAYSLVRYKTPWCIISLMWPLLFLFGWAVDQLAKRSRPVVAAGVAGLILVASFADSIWLNFSHYTDENEPYVYVQTFKDINRVVNPLLAMAKYDPKNYHLNGNFIVSSYYPLPWMLGDFTNIGYYGVDATPTPLDADFLLIEKPRCDDVERRLKNAYFKEQVKIRASQDPCDFLLSYDKFHILFPGRDPEVNPDRANLE